MRVLVTGASGMLGLHVVELLLDKGHEVVSLVRPGSLHKRPWARRVLEKTRVVEASVTEPKVLSEAIRGSGPYDAVIHTAGVLRGRKAEWEVNYGGTRNLLEALKPLKPGILVLVSSIMATGDKLRETAEEMEECLPRTMYEKSKCEAEKLTRAWGAETGWTVVVVRPTWMYGRYSLNPDVPRLLKLAKRGIALVLGGRETPIALVSAKDVAEAIVSLVEAGIGGTYNVRGPRMYRSEEVAEALLAAAGRKRGLKIPIPRPFLKPMTWYMGAARYLLVAPKDVPIRKIEESTGFKPRIELREGLREAAKWLEAAGLL